MKYHRYLILVVVGLCLISPSIVSSEGLSELDMSGFEKKDGSAGATTVKSPFVPAKPAPGELMAEDLYLTGVAIGSGGSYALISGYILSEGDYIAGLRVRSITMDKVVLQHLDQIHTLNIEGGL